MSIETLGTRSLLRRTTALLALGVILTLASVQMRADTSSCGGAMLTLPFSDVPAANLFFCAIAQAYFSGLTNGTTATTYSPSDTVTREQMAAFITRTQDSALRRGNRRALMQQWWTPTLTGALRPVDLGSANAPRKIIFDGADLWVANAFSDSVSRVRASDGRLLQTWTGADEADSIIACAGRIFVIGNLGPTGRIYVIDPESAAAGAVALFTNNIGGFPTEITFDGTYLWTANDDSISRTNVVTSLSSTFTIGFSDPQDIFWDGANLWVTDIGDDQVKRVNPATGAVLETTPVGINPFEMLFDGTNLWVANLAGDDITVVRAVGGLRGAVMQTLTGNGIDGPLGMAFDGERVLVTNFSGNSVSLFKAADFTPLGNLTLAPANTFSPSACSDGVNFWIVRTGLDDIVRF
jgi:YVTN family beta-propeller protein